MKTHLEFMQLHFLIFIPSVLTLFQIFGVGSPPSLFYMESMSELKREFGDLSHLHVVEMAWGNKDNTQELNETTECASYRWNSFEEVNFPLNIACDLLISKGMHLHKKYAQFVEKIIAEIPCGYISGVTDLSIDRLITSLLLSGRKGCVFQNMSEDSQDNAKIIWKPGNENVASILHDIPKLIDPLQSAITYDLNGGRVGDSLISYFHAKWIAMEQGIPFLYKPFPDSDTFFLSDNDQSLGEYSSFRQVLTISKKEEVAQAPPSTLFIVPYFPDCQYECLTLPFDCAYFPMQWNDPKFNQEVRKSLQPKYPFIVRNLPKEQVTVAVHVRRGGTWDNYDWISPILPLKFPPDSYYIEQIQRIARILPDQPLYVYIFTDDLNPAFLAKTFAEALQNPHLTFDWNRTGKFSDKFDDFYSMTQFDCLIRPTSNFSLMASQLGKFALVISPTHCYFNQGKIVVDAVQVEFSGASISLPTLQGHL